MGMQTSLPAAVAETHSLPWELDRDRRQEGGNCVSGPAINTASSGPLFFKGPQGPRAAQPLQGNGDMSSLREGSAQPPSYVVLATRPPGLVGANSWSQPPPCPGGGRRTL